MLFHSRKFLSTITTFKLIIQSFPCCLNLNVVKPNNCIIQLQLQFQLQLIQVNHFYTMNNHNLNSVNSNSNSSSSSSKLKLNGSESLIDQIRCEYHDYQGGELILEKDQSTGIATLCINSPRRKNAFSGTMMAQLTDIVTELEEWKEGKALIVYGANGFFSSGGDLNTVRHIDNSEGGRRMAILMHSNCSRIQRLPMISVALVQGKALGGGAEFTTCCDFRVMTPSAEIGFVHIRLGVTMGWGGGARLCNILGTTKALEVVISGRRVDAEEALRIGLANHIITNCNEDNYAQVLSRAKEWVSQYTKYPIETLHAIKNIITAARWLPLQEALQKEVELFASVWGGPAHQDALSKNIKHR